MSLRAAGEAVSYPEWGLLRPYGLAMTFFIGSFAVTESKSLAFGLRVFIYCEDIAAAKSAAQG
ncbi:MAG: hypothetical protein Fur0044_18600 [Anaerolineae bacterium]